MTHITDEHRRAFEALTSGVHDNFALVSCFVGGSPAAAIVAVNSSGGKDSQCMTILLSRIVPLEQLLIVHAPLGEVEWPGTVNFIESKIPAGVPRPARAVWPRPKAFPTVPTRP